jgi:uncharacterized BrkB/YihY/UPF0761 family membrane protein
VAVRVYQRDHDNFGSVLGSAIAFRLFLFMFALVVFVVGVGALLLGRGWVGDDVSTDLGLTGTLAVEVDEALRKGNSSGALLAIGGLVTTAWAGRNLAITLTAASAAAWRIPRPGGITQLRTVGVVIGLIVAVTVVGGVLRLIKDSAGVVVVATSVLALLSVYSAIWFALTLVLPRATRDPTSLLPGAIVVGATFALLGWVSQFYLMPRLQSGSEILGGLGVAAVALGWLFIASRVMVATLALNAVVYEQFGSLLEGLLKLPGFRRLRGTRAVQWLLDAQAVGVQAGAKAGPASSVATAAGPRRDRR